MINIMIYYCNVVDQVTEVIYVHTKAMVVDDKITIIGSGMHHPNFVYNFHH